MLFKQKSLSQTIVSTVVLSALSSLLQVSAFSATPAYTIENGAVSDSLVDHLDCRTLDPRTVIKKLQPDAFSSSKNLPVRNWGNALLGQCWSLSHAQRLTYYLGRTGATGASSPELVKTVLNLYRGKSPGDDSSDSGLKVFAVPGSSIADSLYNDLSRGFTDGSHGQRTLKTDIEHYQEDRFGDPLNVAMVAGSRDRDPFTNKDTMSRLAIKVAKNRMPLVIIRADRTAQHAILIKSVQKVGDDQYEMSVYDSNYPWSDNHMSYRAGEFYAPAIISGFWRDSDGPVGVFLQDESDMDDIQDALYDYYKGICSSIRE